MSATSPVAKENQSPPTANLAVAAGEPGGPGFAEIPGEAAATPRGGAWAFAALMLGNLALSLGPWSVRLADTGPVSAGFWRLLLGLPLMAFAARRGGERLTGFPRGTRLAVTAAGLFFAFDLALWHLGIARTRLGNATLFGNSGSLVLMVVGIVAAQRRPRAIEAAALVLTVGGAAVLLSQSLHVDARTLAGDVMCILAGFAYAGYILLLQSARERFGAWPLLFNVSLSAALPMLVAGWLMGEPVWPHNWWPLVALALLSQIVGQGLLLRSLKHFSPLVIGCALLAQPGIAVLIGWLVFGETLGPVDALGMVLIAAGLVIGRLG